MAKRLPLGIFVANVLIMRLIYINRQTKTERRYTQKMGMFATKVIYIKRMVLGIHLQTLHKYRETYYGDVKDCADCNLAY